jgi:hypothetical protein
MCKINEYGQVFRDMTYSSSISTTDDPTIVDKTPLTLTNVIPTSITTTDGMVIPLHIKVVVTFAKVTVN